MVILLILIIGTVTGYDLKCPAKAEWRLRANVSCYSEDKYVCLFHLLEKKYEESCLGSDQSSIGSKLVFQPRFNLAECNTDRYQPIVFTTYGNSECIFLKSNCDEEGQVVFSNGSNSIDITCRCDNTKGYAFVSKPKHSCFCIPSEEDCSCFRAKCSNLSSDYQCIIDGDITANTTCQEIHEHMSHNKHNLTVQLVESNINRNTRVSQSRQVTYIIILLIAVSMAIIVITALKCYVFVPPKILSQETITYDQGGKITALKCNVRSYLPLTSAVWCRVLPENVFLDKMSRNVSNGNGIRTIISETSEELESTTYKCKASNIIGTVESQPVLLNAKENDEPLQSSTSTTNDEIQTAIHEFFQKEECGKHYFARVIFIGKNGVGKTSLMRRLLWGTKEQIFSTQSTDGIDIKKCNINVKDGKWSPCNKIDHDLARLIQQLYTEKKVSENEASGQNNEQGSFVQGNSSFSSEDPKAGCNQDVVLQEKIIHDHQMEVINQSSQDKTDQIEVHESRFNVGTNNTKEESSDNDDTSVDEIKRGNKYYINYYGGENVTTVEKDSNQEKANKIQFENLEDNQITIKGVENETGLESDENIVQMIPSVMNSCIHRNADESHYINMGTKNMKVESSDIVDTSVDEMKGENKNYITYESGDIVEMVESDSSQEKDNKIQFENVKANQIELYEVQNETGLGNDENIVQMTSSVMNSCLLRNADELQDTLAFCSLWDFAGQKDYYATHQVFLSKCAVFLLVTDSLESSHADKLWIDFKDTAQYVRFWFDAIHCYWSTTEENRLDPPIIVVCTKEDKIKDLKKRQMRQNEFKRNLGKILKQQKKKEHLRNIYFVSNTEDDDNVFQEIRQDISRLAMNMNDWGRDCPIKWLLFQQVIGKLKDSNVPISTTTKLVTIARHDSIGITNDDEFKLCLQYFHDIGTVIYFDEENLKDYVILDPQWLIEAFRCLVSDKIENIIEISDDWQTLRETGELTVQLISRLFMKEPKLKFLENENHLLEVMKRFDIIVKLWNSAALYMPCMMESCSFKTVKKKFMKKGQSVKLTSWLCLQFEFLPPAFFNHILAWYIKQYHVSAIFDKGTRTNRNALYRQIGVFDLDLSGCEQLVVCEGPNIIALQVWDTRKSGKVYGDLRTNLFQFIEIIRKRYNLQISYTKSFKCKDGDFTMNRKQMTDLVNTDYRCLEHMKNHLSDDLVEPWDFIDELEQMRYEVPHPASVLRSIPSSDIDFSSSSDIPSSDISSSDISFAEILSNEMYLTKWDEDI